MSHRSTILVVDDEPTIRRLLVLALDRPDWRIDEAGGAQEARRAFDRAPYDLVLMDMGLPDSDAVDLFRELRCRRADFGCVMVTAHTPPDTAAEMLTLGALGAIAKPFEDLGHLRRRVELAVQRIGRARRMGRAPARGRRILVALSSDTPQDRIAHSLPDDDLQLVFSADALWQRLAADRWDGLIVDGQLGEVSVVTLVARARDRCPTGGLVLVTEPLPLEILTQLYDLDVSAFVFKPVHAAAVLSGLHRGLTGMPPPPTGNDGS